MPLQNPMPKTALSLGGQDGCAGEPLAAEKGQVLQPDFLSGVTDLERSHAKVRAALILAGKRIRKLSFGRRDDPVLPILRRVLREARAVAKKEGITDSCSLNDASGLTPTSPSCCVGENDEAAPSIRRFCCFSITRRLSTVLLPLKEKGHMWSM
jgi:hypothetical protein